MEPIRLHGKIVKSPADRLNVKTALMNQPTVNQLPAGIAFGSYFGWASVSGGPVYAALAYVGYCPYFKHEIKTIEAHIFNEFDFKIIGKRMKLMLCSFVRPEAHFRTLDHLNEAIKSDFLKAEQMQLEEQWLPLKEDPFFTPEPAVE